MHLMFILLLADLVVPIQGKAPPEIGPYTTKQFVDCTALYGALAEVKGKRGEEREAAYYRERFGAMEARARRLIGLGEKNPNGGPDYLDTRIRMTTLMIEEHAGFATLSRELCDKRIMD